MKRERLASIEKEVVRVLGNVLLTEIKNPRIKGIVSVTKARITDDLKFADVYFSILPPTEATTVEEVENRKKEVEQGLEEIKGFLRKKIADELALRLVPEIRVKIDDSMEYSAKINKILEGLKGK
ncbi:MAG: 30S ribosome-binding factor RbfA [Fusobacteriaceae bacterium]|jgi:ribosome-binding factor A|nr:30S ribosome-binding factor RbfA [Fusobacteriaceae bacterium]